MAGDLWKPTEVRGLRLFGALLGLSLGRSVSRGVLRYPSLSGLPKRAEDGLGRVKARLRSDTARAPAANRGKKTAMGTR